MINCIYLSNAGNHDFFSVALSQVFKNIEFINHVDLIPTAEQLSQYDVLFVRLNDATYEWLMSLTCYQSFVQQLNWFFLYDHHIDFQRIRNLVDLLGLQHYFDVQQTLPLFMSALQHVRNGNLTIDPYILRRLKPILTSESQHIKQEFTMETNHKPILSFEDIEILSLLADGYSMQAIAKHQFMYPSTISERLKYLRTLYQADTNIQLIVKVLENGVLDRQLIEK